METEKAGADQDTATARQTLPIQEFLSKAENYASLITHFPTASQRRGNYKVITSDMATVFSCSLFHCVFKKNPLLCNLSKWSYIHFYVAQLDFIISLHGSTLILLSVPYFSPYTQPILFPSNSHLNTPMSLLLLYFQYVLHPNSDFPLSNMLYRYAFSIPIHFSVGLTPFTLF